MLDCKSAFDGSRASKCVAASAITLILYTDNKSFCIPIDMGREILFKYLIKKKKKKKDNNNNLHLHLGNENSTITIHIQMTSKLGSIKSSRWLGNRFHLTRMLKNTLIETPRLERAISHIESVIIRRMQKACG